MKQPNKGWHWGITSKTSNINGFSNNISVPLKKLMIIFKMQVPDYPFVIHSGHTLLCDLLVYVICIVKHCCNFLHTSMFCELQTGNSWINHKKVYAPSKFHIWLHTCNNERIITQIFMLCQWVLGTTITVPLFVYLITGYMPALKKSTVATETIMHITVWFRA